MAKRSAWPTIASLKFDVVVAFVGDPAERGSSSSNREKAYVEVRARPGISVRELAHRLKTTWPNAKYHAVRLEAAGLIGTRVVGRRRVCFAREHGDPRIVTARALVAEPTVRKVALFVMSHPRESIPGIVAGTRESPRVVYYHIKRLVGAGLLEHELGNRYVGLRPTALAFNVLGEG